MKLRLYKTLWGHIGSLDEAIQSAQRHGFDGLEGQAPTDSTARITFRQKLDEAGLDYIAEICTAGSYVPDRQAPPAEHLASFQQQADAAMECRPRFLTVLAGCDAWPLAASVELFGQMQAFAERLGVIASFETHRSRTMFHPWVARDLLQALPELRITCDFSHWCCVCERLVMDTEPEVLALCAERVHHVHARVGYDQGPQVPHPGAPEHAGALAAHERWWAQLWQAQATRGYEVVTMTPEFGPDGYLQCEPFSGRPVADLVEVNAWMAARQRDRFAEWRRTATGPFGK